MNQNRETMVDVPEVLSRATTTLVSGQSLGSASANFCDALLGNACNAGASIGWVTYTRPPADCAEAVPAGADIAGVIAVGDNAHWEQPDGAVDVEVVATAEDITALGIKLNRMVSEADADLVVCFDSVTAMCQYVDRETAYTFLHTITAQLDHAGARAHFHLDPAAHDPSTVDLFASLCDAVVDIDEDGRTVQTRPAIE
jgi:hypothetical protein